MPGAFPWLGLAAIVGIGVACNDRGPGGTGQLVPISTSSGGGGGAAVGTIAAATSSSTGGAPPLCQELPIIGPPPPPEGIPPDWKPWTCWGLGGDCILWQPPAASALEPLVWDPCELPKTGLSCERLATPPSGDRGLDLEDVEVRVDTSGNVKIGLERWTSFPGGAGTSRIDFLLSNGEGEILAAASQVRESTPAACGMLMDGFDGETAAISIYRGNNDDALALFDASGLTMAWRDPGNDLNSWSMATDHPLQRTYTSLIRHDRGFTSSQTIFESSIVGLSLSSEVRNHGDDIFIQGGSYGQVGVFIWNPERELVTIERFPGDSTRGALALGGDGTHLVWTRGEGRVEPGADLFEAHSIMVSPYTVDVKQLKPRRVRSDVHRGVGSPWVVGCGRAARDASTYEVGGRAQIVDLATGERWLLEPLPDYEWHWVKPLALTCEHAYFWVSIELGPSNFTRSIARVRLDSLGEGSLPD